MIALSAIVLIVLAASLGFVIYSGHDAEPAVENIIRKNAIYLPPEPTDENAPQENVSVSDMQDPKDGELLSLVDGTQTVASDRFTLKVPEGWVVISTKETDRHNDGKFQYGWIYNVQPDDMSDADVVQINPYDILKDGNTFDEIVAANAWDAVDVTEIVSFMSTEAAEAFPDFSEADVTVDMADDVVNGLVAKRNTLQCLKPCYIEGAAQTHVLYFIDAPDRVYLLDVSTNTQASTADFLNKADAVVRTFRLK